MQETLGILLYAPWIYVAVVLSITLDVFFPVLPSGALVVTAAAVAADTAAEVTSLPGPPTPGGKLPQVALLVVCAITASVVGDLLAYRLARRGGRRYGSAIARSPRLRRAQQRLEVALTRGGGALVVLARFAPAGRAVVSLGAGVTDRRTRDFLPWSTLAALAWTAYSVGVGYLGGQLLGASWLSAGLSVVALVGAGVLAARLLRPRGDAKGSRGEANTQANAQATIPAPASEPRTV